MRPWIVEVVAASPAYSLLEVTLPRGTEVPPHVNRHEDLVVQVVTGEIAVAVDGRHGVLGPGAGTHVARGRPRGLTALTDARLLVAGVPGGIEALAAVAADASIDVDDALALLAAAGVDRVPPVRA